MKGTIIQARLGSQRLPAKVMLSLPDGYTVLERAIEGVRWMQAFCHITIVTTPDKLIYDHVKREDLCEAFLYEGPRDPLAEFYLCAVAFNLEHICRVTADCPLLSCRVVDAMWEKYTELGSDRLVYNTDIEYQDLDGQDVEIFPLEYLRNTFESCLDNSEREHVTLWMKRNLLSFKHKTEYKPETISLDTLEDYKKVCQIIESQ